jgi:hypothetical protein
MANERMYPILPCRDLDEAIAFYDLGYQYLHRIREPAA